MSENQFETLMTEIHLLKSDMNGRFSSVDKRLDGIDTRLDGIDTRLDGIDAQLVVVNGELKKIEHATNYDANADVMAKLTALRGY